MSQQEYFDSDEEYEHENVFEFDIPIPFISHTEKRHQILCKLLDLYEDEELRKVFITIATLVDPLTQPTESDNNCISIELISNLIISLTFNSDSIVEDFNLSLKLFKIISSSLNLLNCSDELKLRNLNNSDLKIDWKLKLDEWTPKNLNNQDLRLIYMIDCVSIFTIYKLYSFNQSDLCLNPFLGFFLKLWKIFTNIVLLGLEIDRRVEQISDQFTPNVVKQIIRGSSAVRYILASILNDDIDNRFHDLNHLNIIDFMSPYGRRNGSGALYADVKWYVGAMLALGSELNEVVETLVDLEPNDRYDEDVRYMFDFEYDDFHHDLLYPEDYDSDGDLLKNEPIIYEDEDGNFHKIVEKRCTCEFFNEDNEEDNEEMIDDENNEDIIPTAVRSKDDLEFDEMGRDWRDLPRGGNIFFNSNSKLNEEDCFNFNELVSKSNEMTQTQINDEISQKIINTIGRAVKIEFESNLIKNDEEVKDENLVTPDKIYEKWSSNLLFEKMLSINPELCYCMLDEMFMANGYRRVLIWFITHMALSFSLINYIFELITGLRGENKSKKFIFSRQGSLILSEIEKSMLLHEFLNNVLIFISKEIEIESKNLNEFEKCIKIIKIICLMVNKLLDDNKINIEEYKVELTSLLINWIGLIQEAKELFFRINNREEKEINIDDKKLILKKVLKKHKKFNKELKTSLNNVIKKLDNGSLLFKPFFELIEDNNSNSNDQELINNKELNNYIKGELKPLKFDEIYEHKKVDISYTI